MGFGEHFTEFTAENPTYTGRLVQELGLASFTAKDAANNAEVRITDRNPSRLAAALRKAADAIDRGLR